MEEIASDAMIDVESVSSIMYHVPSIKYLVMHGKQNITTLKWQRLAKESGLAKNRFCKFLAKKNFDSRFPKKKSTRSDSELIRQIFVLGSIPSSNQI